MAAIIRPDLYTTHEGGQWKLWDFGEITKETLNFVTRKKFITINNIQVHSLVWLKSGIYIYSPRSDSKFYFNFNDFKSRWDSVNGWTRGEEFVE